MPPNLKQATAAALAAAPPPLQYDQLVTVPGAAFCRALTYAFGKLWACTQRTALVVADPMDLSKNQLVPLPQSDMIGYDICVINGKLYVTCQSSMARVVEVDPVSLLAREVLVDPDLVNEGPGPANATDGTSLFVLPYGSGMGGPAEFSRLAKYDPTTFRRVATRDLMGLTRGNALDFNPATGRLSATAIVDSVPSQFIEIDPASLDYVSSPFPDGCLNASDDLAFVGTDTWTGVETSQDVFKWGADMTLSRIPTAVTTGACWGLFNVGGLLLQVLAADPGIIQLIDPANPVPTAMRPYTLPVRNPNEAVALPDGSIVVACMTNPLALLKFRPNASADTPVPAFRRGSDLVVPGIFH